MEVFEMPVMTRISPATADRFALFVEALGAETAELTAESATQQTIDRRTSEGAQDVDRALEIRAGRR